MKNRLVFYTITGYPIILLIVISFNNLAVVAQHLNQWSPQQRIPDFHNMTDSPVLLADQNHTVHAFSSQYLGEDEGAPILAVMYNRWSAEHGWTPPVDILLSPLKGEARVMGAFLDYKGIAHVIFVGGDETEANLYYSKAPIVNAHQASAWSRPVLVGDAANAPAAAALTGDDKGNLVIVYSGRKDDWGLYMLYSTDEGDTWTDPEATFLTYDQLFPVVIKLSPGQSGLIHAVWDVRDLGGNGRQINYAQFNFGTHQWSEPVPLAVAKSGYGVLLPTVVEHNGDVIVAYSGVTIRRSKDGGQTWTEPIKPFRHVGVNGIISFVVDSSDILHLLWAQRITGNPDLHGMWHSIQQAGDRWSEPEAVVSGPRVVDYTGDSGFDPYNASAVVSQGNEILVTWRTDPGDIKDNGVWYSYTQVDAPELPVVKLLPPTPTPTATPLPIPTAISPTLTPTRPYEAGLTADDSLESANSLFGSSPGWPVVVAIIPTIFLLTISVIIFTRHKRR